MDDEEPEKKNEEEEEEEEERGMSASGIRTFRRQSRAHHRNHRRGRK